MPFHHVVQAKNNRYEFFMSIFPPTHQLSACILPSLMSDVVLYYEAYDVCI